MFFLCTSGLLIILTRWSWISRMRFTWADASRCLRPYRRHLTPLPWRHLQLPNPHARASPSHSSRLPEPSSRRRAICTTLSLIVSGQPSSNQRELRFSLCFKWSGIVSHAADPYQNELLTLHSECIQNTFRMQTYDFQSNFSIHTKWMQIWL